MPFFVFLQKSGNDRIKKEYLKLTALCPTVYNRLKDIGNNRIDHRKERMEVFL